MITSTEQQREHKMFVRCADELLACLSDIELDALHDIYELRLEEAKKEMDKPDGPRKSNKLAEINYYEAICYALESQSARRR